MKDNLEQLEADVAENLRTLPEVRSGEAFQEHLRNRLLAGHARRANPKRARRFNSLPRYGAVAALLMVMLAGWLAFINPAGEKGTQGTPLFMAQAYAGNVPVPQITLGSGVDGLRQVEFRMPQAIPAAPGEGYVFKYRHGETTVEQAMELAARLGIVNAELVEDGSAIPENQHIYITGANAELVVWSHQGTWNYNTRPGETPGGGQMSGEDMKSAALAWLDAAGLLPPANYTVRIPEPRGQEVLLRLQTAPDGSPVTGCVPEIMVTVAPDGSVTQAYGTWYDEEQAVRVQLADYAGALEALKRGEGIFTAPNYRHDQKGTATVQRVHTAYQLAYAMDFTPYLIPVAVFSGEYQPEGESAEQFTALVPLLKNHLRPNAGNFVLEAELPAAPATLPGVVERGVEASRAEMEQLAEFFNIRGQSLEDGTIRDAGGEISPTSWDGGWLYRTNLDARVWDHDAGRIAETRAVEIASKLVHKIPVLPGVPGKPVVRDDGSGFSLVVFPLLYDGVAVTSSEPPGFASYIAVQLGPDGEVWSVNCARPMRRLPGEESLLTPGQAWEHLLANKSRVHVHGFFGSMPGHRFVAESSRVTGVELAYVPRHPELMRNEHYDLVYVFRGVARTGEREVRFTAYVDALQTPGTPD